ncbi:hypothetical protein RW115_01170 [Macrococcus capreoli]
MKKIIQNYLLKQKLKKAARLYLLNQIKYHDKCNNSELVRVATELLKKN